MLAKRKFVLLLPLSCSWILSMPGLVDLEFFRVWSRCPFADASDGWRCFLTAAAVRPGHDWKNPFCIACIHVDTAGLNAAACRKLMRSGMLCVV